MPYFKISLDNEALAQLGRLAAIWGQIDHFLTVSIGQLTGVSPATVEKLLDQMSMGPKIGRFKKLAEGLNNAEVKELAMKFCDLSGSVLNRRNHLMHGVWGMYSPGADVAYKPACYFAGNKKGLIFADDLGTIIEKATALLDLIGEFYMKDTPIAGDNSQLYMGYGPPEGVYAAPPGSLYMDLKNLGHDPQ